MSTKESSRNVQDCLEMFHSAGLIQDSRNVPSATPHARIDCGGDVDAQRIRTLVRASSRCFIRTKCGAKFQGQIVSLLGSDEALGWHIDDPNMLGKVPMSISIVGYNSVFELDIINPQWEEETGILERRKSLSL
jgi:hypothetical protein